VIPEGASVEGPPPSSSPLPSATVGVFFTNDDGNLQCAGYTQYVAGQTTTIAAFGDDATTDEKDGFVTDEALVWQVATCDGVHTFTADTPDLDITYVTNEITEVASIAAQPAAPTCQTIALPAGWSMFSTYMAAEDMDLVEVLAPIVDKVVIAKDFAGSAYLIEWDFNAIGDMLVGQGYQIKTTEAVELEICGEYMFPEDNPIALTAGWNLIGYLRTEAAPADLVFGDLDAGNLVIAKDFLGAAYLPEWNFNGIGDMAPGQGYQVKTNDADVLQYLSNDESY
jgi:hypothetical protein